MFFQARFKIYIRAAIVVFCLISQCVFAASQMTVVDLDLDILLMSGTWQVLDSNPTDNKPHPRDITLDGEDSFDVTIIPTTIATDTAKNIEYNISIRLHENALGCQIDLEITDSTYFKNLETIVVSFTDHKYTRSEDHSAKLSEACNKNIGSAVNKLFVFRVVKGPDISVSECKRRVKDLDSLSHRQRRKVCSHDRAAIWAVRTDTLLLGNLLNALSIDTTQTPTTALHEDAKSFEGTKTSESITYHDLSKYLFKTLSPEDAQGTATGSM